ncbi:hypothetical protein KAH55_11300 [bacterium]|nr:hypothetical protein [bacterium]
MTSCRLCHKENISQFQEHSSVESWVCKTCGYIEISGTCITQLPKYKKDIWLLSAYFRRRNMKKLPIEMVHTGNINSIIEHMKTAIPRTALEAQNKIIKHLGDNSSLIGSWTEYSDDIHLDLLLRKREVKFLIVHRLSMA